MVLMPDMIVPIPANPIVESTEITEDPIATSSIHFVFGLIVKLPSIAEKSLYPTNSEILKYCLLFLENGSTSEIDALVIVSVDFLMVCPTNLEGSPDILSAIATSLLINSAEDGLIKKSSKIYNLWSYSIKNVK